MQDLRSALKQAAVYLADSASPRLDAEVLLAHVLDGQRSDLYRSPERVLTEAEAAAFWRCIERRKNREPVAYITGWKEFWSLPFRVNRQVLIPRPETEILVEEVARICTIGKQRRLLEIGTGSGAISTALASILPDIEITATDISDQALSVARENAALNKVDRRIKFVQGDLFDPVAERFDVIVSNPPYVSETEYEGLEIGVRGFEPAGALLAGPTGTEFHKRLIEGARPHLNTNGWLVMEIGANQQARVERLFCREHFVEIGFIRDYAGFYRVARGRKESFG
jgi:release factor glutamine methyltransferase